MRSTTRRRRTSGGTFTAPKQTEVALRSRGITDQAVSAALSPAASQLIGASDVPDFSVSQTTVTTDWGVVTVGNLVPTGIDPATVYFVVADEPAGLAAVNG